MMTREEFEAKYPLGSVNTQEDGVVRPMTETEWTAWVDMSMETLAEEQARQDAIAADAAAKQSAIDKLAALGLSVDEIRAAFGLEGN